MSGRTRQPPSRRRGARPAASPGGRRREGARRSRPGKRPAPLAVIALGGNALLREHQEETARERFANLNRYLYHLVDMVAAGYRLAITHGNGPQVGNLLLRMEAAGGQIPPMPLDLCVADTQGDIGYSIQQTLGNLLRLRGQARKVVTVVTQVVVDPTDPAFSHPTKPIGPFYDAARAEALAREKGWIVAEDAGRGYRRVVPSPRPLRIVEADLIQEILDGGSIPIAVGGGGVPVIEVAPGQYMGVEAVIDKDYASAVLAEALGASLLLILTAVDRVAVRFHRPGERWLDRLSVAEARRYLEAGEFPPGSMGPKIEAAAQFVERTGGRAIITSVERVAEALAGQAGTLIA